MRFDGGRLHQTFDLNGAQPRGHGQIVRAAFDPPRPPEEPWIVELLHRCLVVCKVANGGWTLTNQFGDEVVLAYNASRKEWIETCESLLKKALENPNEP